MPKPAPNRVVGFLLLALALPLLAWQATPVHQLDIARQDFLVLHSALEILTIVVAALVFFTGLGASEAERSTRAMELGGGFLAVGLLDLLHLLAYAGMPDLLGPNTSHKAILFWLLARYVAGIGLLAYVLLTERTTPASRMFRLGWFVGVVAVVASLAWLPLTAPERIAPMYMEGVGLSPLKVALEWGGMRAVSGDSSVAGLAAQKNFRLRVWKFVAGVAVDGGQRVVLHVVCAGGQHDQSAGAPLQAGGVLLPVPCNLCRSGEPALQADAADVGA